MEGGDIFGFLPAEYEKLRRIEVPTWQLEDESKTRKTEWKRLYFFLIQIIPYKLG